MTQYLNKTFTVGMPAGKQYRDNWDAIFAKKEAECQCWSVAGDDPYCAAHPCDPPPRCSCDVQEGDDHYCKAHPGEGPKVSSR